jgi:hypothetical protein
MNGIVIAGEPVELLVEALGQFEWQPVRNGRVHAQADLEARLFEPLRRALMRVEAELMTEDADTIGTANSNDRTYEQRSADALMTLALRMAEAARGPR